MRRPTEISEITWKSLWKSKITLKLVRNLEIWKSRINARVGPLAAASKLASYILRLFPVEEKRPGILGTTVNACASFPEKPGS